MNAAIKLLFTTVVFLTIFNSTTFGNTNWKAGDYYCDALDAKITSTPNYYEKINFNLNSKSFIKILDGTIGVVNGIDKRIKTQNKKATFSLDRRKFGFILKKKNTDGTSTHIVRFMAGNQLQIGSKKSILPNQWTAKCTFSKPKTASAAPDPCIKNPKACVTTSLCKLATSNLNGKISWTNKIKNKGHVTEAKKRGVTCGVKKINLIKSVFTNFKANDRIKIQTSLTDLKLYNSEIDGDFGPGTEKAIKRYLSKNNFSNLEQVEILNGLESLLAEENNAEELVITSNNLPIENVASSYLFAKVIHVKANYIQVTETKPIEVCKNVSTPVKTCQDEQVPVYGQVNQNNDAAANALIGALMGGIAGQAVTEDNSGASIGALMGGLIGSSMNSNNNSNNIVGYETVEKCKTVTKQERSCKTENEKVTSRKLKNYKITYDFHGQLGKTLTKINYQVGDKIPLNLNISAQLLINDVENFLKIGAGTFGLEFTKKYSSVRQIIGGAWSKKLETDFNDFQMYVYQNQDFIEYATAQKQLRQEQFNNSMGDNRKELTNLTNNLTEWLQTNLLHERATEIYDLVGVAELSLKGTDLTAIRQNTEQLLKVSQQLNLTKKSKSLEEINKAERKITEEVFNNYDASGRIEIQKALGDMGLFKLPIDGKYGTGLHLAIKQYMKKNGLKNIDTTIAVEEQLTILVPTSTDVNTLSVIKNKISNEDEWKEAVVLIQDLETFIASNPTAFGFEFIKKYKSVRDLADKLWDAEKKSKFIALKKYVLKNESFRPYLLDKQAKRKEVLIEQLNTLRTKVKRKEVQINKWLQSNLLDEKAEEILTGLQEMQSAVKGQSLIKLASALNLAENFVSSLGLIDSAELELNKEEQLKSDETEWKEAVILIQDLEAFIAINPSVFGFEFIKKYKPVRDLGDRLWDSDQELKFRTLQKYVLKNKLFELFLNKKEAERNNVSADKLETLKANVKRKENQLNKWLQTNLLDEKAEDVLIGLQEIQSAVEGESLVKLKEALNVAEDLINTLGLIDNVQLETKIDINFNSKALYYYANLTEKAQNLFRNLESNLELEEDHARICQIGNIDQWSQFVAYNKLKNLIELTSSNIVTNNDCSNSEDIYIIKGSSLERGDIPNNISIQNFNELYVLERGEAIELKRGYLRLAEENYDAVISGTKEGYGLFYIPNHPTKMCSSISKNQEAHNIILQDNKDIVNFFTPSAESMEYNLSINELNKRLQRKKCGVVYGAASDLKVLTEAIINGKIYEIRYLPIWVTTSDLKIILSRLKNLQSNINAESDKTEEEIALDEIKRKKLEEIKINAAQEAVQQQKRLRENNEIKFSSLIDRTHPTLSHIANEIFDVSDGENYQVDIELKSLLSTIQNELINKKLEGWEITSNDLIKIDYGTVLFKGRKLEAMVANFQIEMKNREVGSFETYCKKVHITYDTDFDMWRKELFSDCLNVTKTVQWQLTNGFESGWVVTAD